MILCISSDKAFDKTSGFMIKGCLALEVIQSTHQFPDFILKATEHFILRLPSRIIPYHGREGPHHQGTHPRRLIIVWLILHHCPVLWIQLFEYIHTLARGVHFTHMIRSSMPREDIK